ncbi:MAG: response regulator transcription factor [Bacteroidetes bacterium]|nr:response regulator transcription factor [Bacteroidota bacterium]
MIQAIIVEDEFFGQELLKKYLFENFEEIEIVAAAASVNDAIEAIKKHNPQLVFLDIQLIGGTGFDVLAEVKTIDFELIFITAYNQHAISAIKQDAVDYILKPIKVDEFISGVNRALGKIKEKVVLINKENILVIHTSIGAEYINENEIICFEADGTYTSVICENKKILSSKNIGEYEKILLSKIFFRTHHSYIINTNKIKRFEKGRSGKLVLLNGLEIPVSQRKIKEFIVFMQLKEVL